MAAGLNVRFRPYESLASARRVKTEWSRESYYTGHFEDFRIEKSVTSWEVVE